MRKLSVVFLLLISSLLSARDYEYPSSKFTGAAIIGANFYVKDALFKNPSYSSSWVTTRRIYDQQAYALVALEYNGALSSGTTRVEVQVRITGADASNAPLTEDHTLVIEDNASPSAQITDRAFVLVRGLHDIRVRVLSVKMNGQAATALSLANVPVSLSSSVKVSRTFMLGTGPIALNPPADNGDTIRISWPAFTGAEEYDLEWAYINNYKGTHAPDGSPATPGTVSDAGLKYDFVNNSTRVRVSGTSYSIPDVFGSGYILFRLRAVTYKKTDKTGVVTSNWTSPDKGAISLVSTKLAHGLGDAHEPAMNWIYEAAYAEEGKHKDKVVYADGLTKPRQEVTLMPSKGESIAKETIYDEFGRPIVELLPSPMGVNALKFFDSLNVSVTSGKPLSYEDFVAATPGACGSSGQRLDSADSKGAGYYYSKNNKSVTGMDRYTPDAEGYPYTQIEYTADRTGRVSRQTIPGEEFRMNSGQETQTIYSQPLQVELNRLFGTDIGYADHYSKTSVVDPNGQVSVTITDLAGKPVVTYLDGANPLSVSALPSNPINNPVPLTSTILRNQPITNGLQSIRTIGVNNDANYQFHYEVVPEAFLAELCTDTSVKICYTCHYKLELLIVDECGGNPELLGPAEATWPRGVDLGTFENMACTEKTTYSTDFTARLGRGTYHVIKRLVLNMDSAAAQFEDMMSRDTCTLSLQDFVEDELARTDFSDCEDKDCQSACDAKRIANDIPGYYECLLSSVCESHNATEGKRDLMLRDMMPGGQYATYTTSFNETTQELSYSATSVTSILNTGNAQDYATITDYKDAEGNPAQVMNSAGTLVSPQSLTLKEFVENFQTSWTAALLPLHPEYACLERAEDTLDLVEQYEQLMLEVEDYRHALSLGLLNPYNNHSGLTFPTPNPVPGLAKDPFFQPGFPGYNTALGNEMDDFLSEQVYNYTDGSNNTLTVNIWEMAAIMTGCAKEGATVSQVNTCIAAIQSSVSSYYPTTPDECFDDMVWHYFKTLYLGKRQQIIEKWQESVPCGDFTQPPLDTMQQRFAGGNETLNDKYDGAADDPIGYHDNNPNTTSTAANCDSTCSTYAEFWVSQLSACFEGLSPSERQALEDTLVKKMTEVCMQGCDSAHFFGSSNVAPGKPGTWVNGSYKKSFDEIILHYFPDQTIDCNPELISMPMSYEHEYTHFQESQPADTCACNFLFDAKAKYDAATDLPAEITNFEDYVTLYLGVEQPKVMRLLCACDDAYFELTGNTPPAVPNWPSGASALIAKKAAPIPVIPGVGCEVCINCNTFGAFIDSMNVVLADYGIDENSEDSLNYYALQVLLNSLSDYYKTDLTREDLDYFTATCKKYNPVTGPNDLNPGDTSLVITGSNGDKIESFRKFFNYLFQHGDATGEACLCEQPYTDRSQPSNGAYSYPVGSTVAPHYDPLDCAHTYTGQSTSDSVITGVLSNPDSSGDPCNLTIAFASPAPPYDISKIVYLENMRPYATESGTVKSVIATATIDVAGEMRFAEVIITGDCFDFGTAHDTGDADFKELCLSKPAESDEDECYNSLMEIVVSKAMEAYTVYRDALKREFYSAYAKKCLSVKEVYNTTFDYGAHHYTLYYYDQAGNLVKTIPPEGVEPIIQPLLGQVDARRDTLGPRIPANHRMATVYEYNSLNQVVRQHMPDHNDFSAVPGYFTGTVDDHSSQRFWYDHLGRVVLSQNSRQAAMIPPRYSYSVYDHLSRVVESGELGTVIDITPGVVTAATFPDNLSNLRFEVMRTFYDQNPIAAVSSEFGSGGQQNLRNRVACIAFYEFYKKGTTADDKFRFASHYSYDIHGNVKTLIQDYAELAYLGRYRRMDYKYDLISGKVNEVAFQKKDKESFYHRYSYDEDNRITRVETSREGVIWDEDAAYTYYRFGPLAQTRMGRNKVQSTEMAYTIQGWLKAINGASLAATIDPANGLSQGGNVAANYNTAYAADAYAGMLTYFRNPADPADDYKPVNATGVPFAGSARHASAAGGSLYNGNIMNQTVALRGENGNAIPLASYDYSYDQLNRIKGMDASIGAGITSVNQTSNYQTRYSYDANGNLLTLTRRATNTAPSTIDPGSIITDPTGPATAIMGSDLMDELTYSYPLSGGKLQSNRLLNVRDNVSVTAFDNDFDDRTGTQQKYVYDNIGNLVEDKNDSLKRISWDNRGKVRYIETSRKYGADLEFAYDAMGNRALKVVKPRINGVLTPEEQWEYQWYLHDAQSNVMGIYDMSVEQVASGKYREILNIAEWNLYGIDRLGLQYPTGPYSRISEAHFSATQKDTTGRYKRKFYYADAGTEEVLLGDGSTATKIEKKGVGFSYPLGLKNYELSNHLGNVMSVITDRKLPMQPDQLNNATTTILGYIPQILSYSDYYPFGSLIPGRGFTGQDYRYGFNAMERDDELFGDGNSYTTLYRQYDPRLGRWKSLDPKARDFPWQSPYVGMDNKPTIRNDVNGDCPTCIAAAVGAGLGAAMEMVIQIGEHMSRGMSFEAALSKINYLDVTKEAAIGGLAGLTGFGAARYITKATKVLKSPAGRMILAMAAEQIVDYAVSTAAEYGYQASGLEATLYGVMGFSEKTNKEIGDIGEAETKKALEKKYGGKGFKVLEQQTGVFKDGTKTVFDFVVVDQKGNIVEVAESKVNTADYTKQQRRFWGRNGEAVKIGGKTVDPSNPKIVSTTYRHTVNRFTGTAALKGTKNAIKSVLKVLK